MITWGDFGIRLGSLLSPTILRLVGGSLGRVAVRCLFLLLWYYYEGCWPWGCVKSPPARPFYLGADKIDKFVS